MPRKNPVAISSDLVEDFFPQTKVPPPVSTSSTVSVSAPCPLDEIGLLKKGRLNTKYQRRMSLEDVEKPITLEEMARRGMLTKSGRLVHRLPTSSTCSSKGTTPSPSSMLSTGGGALSKVFEEAVISSKTYDVGLPEERAQLKIGQTTRGERLELIVAHQFHAILDLSDKCKTLVTFKP